MIGKKLFSFLLLGLTISCCTGCGSSDTSGSSRQIIPTLETTQSFEGSRSDVPSAINNLSSALIEKNPEAAAAVFTPEVRDEYLRVFTTDPEAFQQFGMAIKNASMTFQDFDHVAASLLQDSPSLQNYQSSEVLIEHDSMEFCIKLQKRDGTWFVQSL
ncbi:MAG: hypothetical protein HQM10_21825 [Candidatus Riflebacteria bacterium]|nr:hypothetical protein [Candidatus Riflebacteria bacterium]